MSDPASPPNSKDESAPVARRDASFLRENWQALVAAGFGVFFVCVLLAIALIVEDPKPFSLWVFRVVLALAAAGVGAVLPGLIHVEVPGIRTAGAIALFVLVFKVNPPELVQPQSVVVTPPAVTSGVPLSAVADLILGINPTETRSSQEALLRRTLNDLTISAPLLVGSETTSNDCSVHRTAFLQSPSELIKLQTFAVPTGHLRVRGLSDGQQKGNLVTARSFVAVSDPNGFRRITRTTRFNDVNVYDFDTTAPSNFFIASYYPTTAFSQGADEVGVEISDMCANVDVVSLTFAAMPFDEIEFRHAYETPAQLTSPPLLKPFPDHRIETARSGREEVEAAFGAFVQFIRADNSNETDSIVKTWDLIVAGRPETQCAWESRRYRNVTGDLLVVARGKRSTSRPTTDEAVPVVPKAS